MWMEQIRRERRVAQVLSFSSRHSHARMDPVWDKSMKSCLKGDFEDEHVCDGAMAPPG